MKLDNENSAKSTFLEDMITAISIYHDWNRSGLVQRLALERWEVFLSEESCTAYYASKDQKSKYFHISHLPMGCKDSDFKTTPCICWKKSKTGYSRTTHLPGKRHTFFGKICHLFKWNRS